MGMTLIVYLTIILFLRLPTECIKLVYTHKWWLAWGEMPVLRRDFLGAAVSATIVSPTIKNRRLDALVSELRSVLANDATIDHFDIVYEPGSATSLIVAAYGKMELI